MEEFGADESLKLSSVGLAVENHDADGLARAVMKNPGADRDKELDASANERPVSYVCGTESKVESSKTSTVLKGCGVEDQCRK